MAWCSKCKMEYREGVNQCIDCKCELVEVLDVDTCQEDETIIYEDPILLISLDNEVEAKVIEGLLQENWIPVLRKYKHAPNSKIPCYCINSIELYIPPNKYEEAIELIGKTEEDVEREDTEVDDESNIGVELPIEKQIKNKAFLIIITVIICISLTVAVANSIIQ